MNIDDYVFGTVVTDEIGKSDARKFAEVFGEGSKNLTDLIEFCILNDLNTFASCKGHPENGLFNHSLLEEGYLSFDLGLDYESGGDFAYFLADLPSSINNITSDVEYSNMSFSKTITLRVPSHKEGMSEIIFKSIYDCIKKYVELKSRGITYNCKSDEIKKIVDHVFEIPSNEIIVISNKRYLKIKRGELNLSLCPSYNNTNVLHKLFNSNRVEKVNKFLDSKIGR